MEEYKAKDQEMNKRCNQIDSVNHDSCGSCILDLYERFDAAVLSADILSLHTILLELYQVLLLTDKYSIYSQNTNLFVGIILNFSITALSFALYIWLALSGTPSIH